MGEDGARRLLHEVLTSALYALAAMERDPPSPLAAFPAQAQRT